VLTDGDGNPATGPEPTVVVGGDQQQLTITKGVAVVGGGPAVAGATLEYTIRVLNVSSVPATFVEIYDDLDVPVAGQLTYVDQSATMNGAVAGITFAGSLLTADYSSVYGPLAPDEELLLRFQAVLDPNLPIGTVVINTADLEWNDPAQTASATVSLTVGGEIGSGVMSGTAWHDSNFDNVRDAAERDLVGWTVQLRRNGQPLHTTITDTAGAYRISGVPPNYLTPDEYEIQFSAPGAVTSTAPLGLADSEFTDYLQRIADIVVESGSILQDMNLPIDPNGVVYNSMGRAPIAGVMVTLVEAASGIALPTVCFDDAAQQNQVTQTDGYYKFDVNFDDFACADGGDYLIELTAPGVNFEPGFSDIIPPAADPAAAPLSVPLCPGTVADAVPGTLQYCEAQPFEFAPGATVPARGAGTAYFVHLTLDGSQPPGSSQIFNNHLPIDPVLDDAVSITKVTPAVNVTRGQLVPYIITVTNDIGFDLTGVSIVDRFPAGFRYIEGSARIDDQPIEPVIAGREMLWSDLGIAGAGRHTLELLMAVGAGVSEGEFVNRAQVMQVLTGNALSNEASATVRLVPDPDLDCTDVMGKVFDDANRNGVQDPGEGGIPGVRLVTATGRAARTAGSGRFHITCATVPTEGRGSNFVLKLDDRTLPTGYRNSIEPIRVERATRGKALRFNFAASIHRVIGLDISDPVFVPGETELRSQWSPRLGLLLEELERAPATLRLSYLADLEDEPLVNDRVDAISSEVLEAWEALGSPYELSVETEIFWRLGEPADERPGDRVGRR